MGGSQTLRGSQSLPLRRVKHLTWSVLIAASRLKYADTRDTPAGLGGSAPEPEPD